MKYAAYIIILFLSCTAFSQTYIKINAGTALVLVPQIGIETTLNEKITFQVDILGSFWKSVEGAPMQAIMVFAEPRFYLKKKFHGFYAAPHLGGSIFKIQKWNYFGTDYYQKGFSYMMGATIGFQHQLGTNWVIDIFLGGGNQQGLYKGYNWETGERYDKADRFNKSGEWLIYRGGLFLGYKF